MTSEMCWVSPRTPWKWKSVWPARSMTALPRCRGFIFKLLSAREKFFSESRCCPVRTSPTIYVPRGRKREVMFGWEPRTEWPISGSWRICSGRATTKVSTRNWRRVSPARPGLPDPEFQEVGNFLKVIFPRRQSSLPTELKSLYDLLSHEGGLASSQIASRLGIHQNTALNRLKKLQELRLVNKKGQGSEVTYELTGQM